MNTSIKMGLVNLLSELADRLQSDAKRFTEDKDKILQSIESLSDLLKSDSCKSISKGKKFFRPRNHLNFFSDDLCFD